MRELKMNEYNYDNNQNLTDQSVEQLQREIGRLKDALKDAEVKLESATANAKDLRSEADSMDRQRRATSDDLIDLDVQLEFKIREKDAFQEDIYKKRAELMEAEAKYEKACSECNSLTQTVAAANNHFRDIQDNAKKKEHLADNAEAILNQCEDEIVRIENALSEKEDSLSTVLEQQAIMLKRQSKEKKQEARLLKRNSKGNRWTLFRTPKEGKLDRPIRFIKQNWKKVVAGTLIVVGLGTGIFFLTKDNKHKDDFTNIENNDNEYSSDSSNATMPKDTNSSVTVPEDITSRDDREDSSNILEENTIDEEKIDSCAQKIYSNWKELNTEYSKEDIIEIIKCLNGYPSEITIDMVDGALLDVLNNAIAPGINNLIIGEDVYKTKKLDFSTLLIDDPSKGAVVAMEKYLNGSLTDSKNVKIYIIKAFEDEAIIAIENETVSSFDLTTASSGARLLWSRLAIGVNGFAGTLEDDLKVTVGNNIYTQEDLNNSDIFETIARNAKKDLGDNPKEIKLK